jgi:tetratricopeptide (TPR) repeat protein
MTSSNNEEYFSELYEAAVSNLRQHNISTTVELLLKARELKDDTVQVDSMLGSCYLVLGEYEKAVACWQNILAINPNHKSARQNLELYNRPSYQIWIKRYKQAVAEVEKKNYQIAGDMLKSLLLEQDGDVALYQLLGLCCLAGGNREEAIRMWQKGLELDHSNAALHEYLESLPAIREIDTVPAEITGVKINRVGRGRLIWAVSGILLVFLAVPVVFHINRVLDNNSPQINKRNEQKVVAPAKEMPIQSTTNQLTDSLTPAGSQYDVSKEEEYYYAGWKAYLSRNWKSAADNYSMVVGMASGSYLNREALYYLARTNYLRGELGQAEQYYIKYLKDFSGTAYYDDCLFFLGCIYSRQNDNERAKEVFRQLKNVAPESGYLSSHVYRRVME